MNQNLEELLLELDQSQEPINDNAICSKITKATSNDQSIEAIAENIAFSFYENYSNKMYGWGTYFGPMAAWSDKDGNVYENPSISMVTEEILQYWEGRSEHTNNPIMKARYSGLIWDLSKSVLGRMPNYSIAERYVQALIESTNENLCEYPTQAITKITRAYKVASSLNNIGLIQQSIEGSIALEDRIAEDDKAGLWGFSFDLFVLGKERHLKEEQEQKLIKDLEDRLIRVSLKCSPWVCEAAGVPLATYYRSKGLLNEVKRVIELVGNCFENSCKELPAIQASSWYRHAHDIYIKFNMSENAESVAKKISQIGPDVVESMQKSSYSKEIPKKELDTYLESMTKGGLSTALSKITVHFLPKKDQIEEQVLDLARDHPISFLFTKTLQDHRGRPVATIGGIENDLEGNIIHQLSQNMGIASFFLRHSLNKASEIYEMKAQQIAEYIFKSPIFEEPKKEIILIGVNAFLDKNYVAAIHILIPQIEAAIRFLVEQMGGATLRNNRQGGLQLRTFDDLLRDELVEQCFGSDLVFYFRALLTDQRGWNVRNNVCHGITPINEFNYLVADRIIHVLLCLAQVRAKALHQETFPHDDSP